MARWLLIIFMAVPVLEIWGLVTVGGWIGAWQTALLVLLTGGLGAYLAKREFRQVWFEANRELQSGQIPGQSVIDGLCVCAGGLLLLTPGFFTDALGVVLLVPVTRAIVRAWAIRQLRRQLDKGAFQWYYRR